MSEQDKPSHEDMLKFAQSLEVNQLTISVSAKRTIKVNEDFRSFEAFESWSFGNKDGAQLFSVPPAFIQFASAYWTPKLIAKVYYTLYAGQVISYGEMRDRIKEATSCFSQITELKDGKTSSSADVRGSGEPVGSSDAGPSNGSSVPEGKDGGVPSSSGQSELNVHDGESGIRSDSPSSPVPEGNLGSTTSDTNSRGSGGSKSPE